MISASKYLTMKPDELLTELADKYLVKLPDEITSIDDMNKASKLMLKLSSGYSFLNLLHTTMQNLTRSLKKTDKEAYEVMMERRNVVQCIIDINKQQYQALSRGVTIKIENNKELQMCNF